MTFIRNLNRADGSTWIIHQWGPNLLNGVFVSKQCGPIHAAPPAYRSGRGGGEDEGWLTGRVEMDYWMHIGISFSCQEIDSIVRKSIPLTVLFFITVQGHNSDFWMHTLTKLRRTDVAGLSDLSLSGVTVCRFKRLISAAWCQPVITIIWCLFPRAAQGEAQSDLAVTCSCNTDLRHVAVGGVC